MIPCSGCGRVPAQPANAPFMGANAGFINSCQTPGCPKYGQPIEQLQVIDAWNNLVESANQIKAEANGKPHPCNYCGLVLISHASKISHEQQCNRRKRCQYCQQEFNLNGPMLIHEASCPFRGAN